MSSRASSRAANRKGQGKQVSDAQLSANSSGSGSARVDTDGSHKMSRRAMKKLAQADACKAEATTAQEQQIKELQEQL